MQTAVEAVNVSKRFGRHRALHDITLAVERGDVLGLIGPNGAGKTTLLRILGGLMRPTTGSVRVEDLRNGDAIRYFGGEHTLAPNVRVDRWLSLWRAPGAAPAPRRPFGVLSRGTRQRWGLEAMLSAPAESRHAKAGTDATLFLLDEPWEGLDPDATRWLSDTLIEKRSGGAALIVSSHRIHDLSGVCDRCVFLIGGRLAPEVVVCEGIPAAERSDALFEAFDRWRGGK